MKRNCWEVLDCGRQTGGTNAAELGVCPAAQDSPFNGRNGGTFAGRFCWRIVGTLCGGEIQGTLVDKVTTCVRCDFFNQVKREEGAGFKVSALWDASLEIGIPLIDGQHMKLVAHLEELLGAAAVNTSSLSNGLRFLEKYTQEHFSTEERFMAAHGFPGLTEHAKVHASFRTSLVKAHRLIEMRQDPAENPKLVKSLMLNWYVNHITGMDQQYALFFRQKGVVQLIR